MVFHGEQLVRGLAREFYLFHATFEFFIERFCM